MSFTFSFKFKELAYTYLNHVNFYYDHYYLSTIQFTDVNNTGYTTTYEKYKTKDNKEFYNVSIDTKQYYNLPPDNVLIPDEVKECLNIINIKQLKKGNVIETFTDNITLFQ